MAAQERHIVLDLEGIIVHSMGRYIDSSVKNRDQIIRVQAYNTDYFLYVYPSSIALVNYLQNEPNTKLHFASRLPWLTTKAIFDTLDIKLQDGSKIIYPDETKDRRFDLSQITDQKNDLVYFTTTPKISQSIYVGMNLSYEDIYTTQNKLGESDWQMERNKPSYIYQLLNESSQIQAKNLQSSLKKVKTTKEELVRKGFLASRYKFAKEVSLFKFNKDKSKVTGCGLFSPREDLFKNDLLLKTV